LITRSILIPPVLWLFIITVLLTLPGSALPKENWLDKLWGDKLAHIFLFTLLVILWCRFFASRFYKNHHLKRIFIVLALLATLYGLGMEYVQKYWVNNRSFDLLDVAANAAGCAIGLAFSLKRYIKK
jgi:VanZ family protein